MVALSTTYLAAKYEGKQGVTISFDAHLLPTVLLTPVHRGITRIS